MLAFPVGLDREFEAVSPGVQRLTQTHARSMLAKASDLVEGEPVDFRYPLEEQLNFLVQLGTPANGGVGPEGDIVAFSYFCSHICCPLNGLYNRQHKMLGPCPRSSWKPTGTMFTRSASPDPFTGTGIMSKAEWR